MKHHIVIMLLQPISNEFVPYWEDFIRNKNITVTSFMDDLDLLFLSIGDFWITREYPSASKRGFNESEIKNGFNRIYRIILYEGISIPEGVLKRIQAHPSVVWVRLGETVRTWLPSYSATGSNFSISNWPANMIGLPFAHALTKGHRDINIAVLDTGIDRNHPEISYKVEKDFVHLDGLNTEDFIGDMENIDEIAEDAVGHGTHVAGIISAKGLQMPEGIAPQCSLMVIRVLATLLQNGRRVGAGLIDNINTGIKWAVDNGADVINMSLGVRHEGGGLPHKEVIQYAQDQGVIIVAATGNDGTNNKYYPGALPGVIAVGAVDSLGSIAPFSSYGAAVSYLAPGTQILSAFRNGGYAASSGTSQASPFVTGAIALLKAFAHNYDRELNHDHINYLLKHTSNRTDKQIYNTRGGYGVIHLADAFKLLRHEILH